MTRTQVTGLATWRLGDYKFVLKNASSDELALKNTMERLNMDVFSGLATDQFQYPSNNFLIGYQ